MTKASPVKTTTPVRIPGEWKIPYNYTIGDFASSFFEGLKSHKILGCKCGKCGRVSVPPKSFCEYCFVPVEELVEVGHKGVIEAITVVTAPFAGSPDVPYAVAYVRLDGATSSIANYVYGVSLDDPDNLPESLQIESPVRVVFGPEPQGQVTDFWFETDEQ
ncbi:Zn-ribbon domain-containing OB-fold protein [Rhodococcus qingshengii]|uniref:Zn-ribbon domain-containing OB-fold protein n=1 Tax=Rhodococcus qingshengii TaxID=334542 RepID=UPI001E3E76AA|nr:Zn-ribbon domain-containing OB-fold protein [Rhodococcus qingshengii]MCQ4150593.1 Zn-ribbon domain-containing OB-fold protein [Rhodococcus qingshengii]UGQ55419.1 Zn-ribbon domain-containing OB-fold protein [Rhodococcus qingshengii]